MIQILWDCLTELAGHKGPITDRFVRDFNVRWWGFWRYDQSRVIAGPGFLGVFGPAQQSLLYLRTPHPMRSLMFLVFPLWALQGLNTKK